MCVCATDKCVGTVDHFPSQGVCLDNYQGHMQEPYNPFARSILIAAFPYLGQEDSPTYINDDEDTSSDTFPQLSQMLDQWLSDPDPIYSTSTSSDSSDSDYKPIRPKKPRLFRTLTKTHKCPFPSCQSVYTHAYDVPRHIRKCHQSWGMLNYDKWNPRHMRRQQNEFKCVIHNCSCSYRQQTSLIRHMRSRHPNVV